MPIRYATIVKITCYMHKIRQIQASCCLSGNRQPIFKTSAVQKIQNLILKISLGWYVR